MSDCNNDCPTTDSAVAAAKAPELQLDRQSYLNLHFTYNEDDDDYYEEDDDYDVDIEHDLAYLPEDDLPVIEKRKTARKVEPVDSTVPKKACPELPWHPMFNQDCPRIILLSNDNQRLCVNKDILTSYSTVFKDMFSVPTNPLKTDRSEPIFVDERADVLALVLSHLHGDHEYDRQAGLEEDISVFHAAVKAYDKFDIEIARKVHADFKAAIREDPFKVFTIASQQNNLDLGRMAIKNMTHRPHRVGKFDFWQEVSGATLLWQVALARLLVPHPSLWTNVDANDNEVTALTNIDTGAMAEKFDPR